MNQISDPPNQYDFGLEFNYAVWTANTRVSLVNVPWNNDYRDIVKFANRAALNTYINGLENAGYVFPKMTYVKPGEPIRVNLPINAVYKFNYLRAHNPAQPVPGNDVARDWYYFITDVRYLAPNTTEIVLQLDVWQSFGFDITFGNCYLERGHMGIANKDQFADYGRRWLTVPEGIETGNEYLIVDKKSKDIMGLTAENGTLVFKSNVLVVSTVDLEADAGTVTAPKLVTAKGGFFEGMPSGADIWVFESVESFLSFMQGAQNKPWVTQGIISATIIPMLTRYDPTFDYEGGVAKGNSFSVSPVRHAMWTDWRNSSDIINYIPSRYRHLRKFFTYPYMMIEMTTWTGNPILIKPEAWASKDATVIERATFTPPGQRIEFYPGAYNSRDAGRAENFGNFPDFAGMPANYKGSGDDFGEYLDHATRIANFPTIPLVNNGQLGYLASNFASIPQQFKSADWTQQRALGSAQTSYDQASQAMHLAQSLSGIGVNADIAQTANTNRTQLMQGAVDSVFGMFGGAAGGAMSGGAAAGPMGAAGGAVAGAANGVREAARTMIQTGIQIGANDESLAIRNAQAAQTVIAQGNTAQYMRDTNKDLADWAAKGDYQTAIAQINAKVQDASMIQPSVSGQYGGEASNLVNFTAEISLRWKMLDLAHVRMIGDYWLRFGYAVQAFTKVPASLQCMTKFTYWKMRETYITSGPMPESFKQAIRGMFEKGVTVYNNPADIGTVDWGDNAPLSNITIGV
jgi:hypothetical protein